MQFFLRWWLTILLMPGRILTKSLSKTKYGLISALRIFVKSCKWGTRTSIFFLLSILFSYTSLFEIELISICFIYFFSNLFLFFYFVSFIPFSEIFSIFKLYFFLSYIVFVTFYVYNCSFITNIHLKKKMY